MITFKNSSSNEINQYSANCNILYTSDALAKTLRTPNYENSSSPWVFLVGDDEHKIFDVMQIKVNIVGLGAIIFYFNKDKFTVEDKDKLFAKLTELKEIELDSVENRKKKIISALAIADEFNPYFAYFSVQKYFDEAILFLRSGRKDKGYPVFIALDLNPNAEEEKPQKEKKVRVKKEKKEGEKKSIKDIYYDFMNSKFVDNLKKEGMSYLFNGIYALLLSTVLVLMFSFFYKNEAGYAVVFIIFIAVFATVIAGNLRLFIKKKNLKEWRTMLPTLVAFNAIALICIVLGILIGYGVTLGFLMNEETKIDFNLTIPLSIGISLFIYCASIVGGYFFDKFSKKNKK